MSVDILKLKALAQAAKQDQYDYVALNDYGMAMPPAVTLELIAEIERHRQVNAKGCKPDSNILLSGLPSAGAASSRSLDEVEGCKPDLNTSPAQATEPAKPLTISLIREVMEESACGRAISELQVGETHLRVTYRGIKWHHDRLMGGRWEPLSIEEFDEALCDALKRGVPHG